MDVSTSKTAKARLLRPTDANLKGFTATMGKSLWLKGRIHKPCGQQKKVKVGKMGKIGEKMAKIGQENGHKKVKTKQNLVKY